MQQPILTEQIKYSTLQFLMNVFPVRMLQVPLNNTY